MACCGNSSNEVYEIYMKTLTVVKTSNTNSIRGFPGIANYMSKFVYLFGGNNSVDKASAEKYDLSTKTWAMLPSSMVKAMFAISVCKHSSGFYLHGIEITHFEHFNPNDESFQLLLPEVPRWVTTLC